MCGVADLYGPICDALIASDQVGGGLYTTVAAAVRGAVYAAERKR